MKKRKKLDLINRICIVAFLVIIEFGCSLNHKEHTHKLFKFSYNGDKGNVVKCFPLSAFNGLTGVMTGSGVKYDY